MIMPESGRNWFDAASDRFRSSLGMCTKVLSIKFTLNHLNTRPWFTKSKDANIKEKLLPKDTMKIRWKTRKIVTYRMVARSIWIHVHPSLTSSSLHYTVLLDLYLNSATASLGTSNRNICQQRISTCSYVHAFVAIHSIHRQLKPTYCCDHSGTLERDNTGLSALPCLQAYPHMYTVAINWYTYSVWTRIVHMNIIPTMNTFRKLFSELVISFAVQCPWNLDSKHCLLFVFLNLVKTSISFYQLPHFHKCNDNPDQTKHSEIKLLLENITHTLASYWRLWASRHRQL